MAETFIVSCPSCGMQYTAAPEQAGQKFQCTQCQATFQAIGGGSGAAPPLSPGFRSPQMMDYGSGLYRQKTSGLAIASLVCGILFCVPLCSVLAIIFGIIGINQTKPGRDKGRGMAVAGLVLGCVYFLVVVAILIPALSKARSIAGGLASLNNMKQISTAISMYHSSYGAYPPDLTTLWKNEPMLTGKMFVTPVSLDTAAAGPSQLETGGHLSYTYIYPGPNTKNADPADVLLYENPAARSGTFAHILSGDGQVRLLTARSAQLRIDKTVAHGPN